MEQPFREAKPIIEMLQERGHEAYFVGGSVRDFILGREIGDVDIATSAKPDEIQAIFTKTIDVGAEHGTIIVLHNGHPYEVTTFRSEAGYTDFRRPSHVTFIQSLKEDLKRRDFTMNAIAMTKDGELIDYFEGRKAIEDKVIETVGSPEDRFSEDALRMLRAVRFVSQLSFTLRSETKAAILNKHELLRNISVERKTVELEKLLKGQNVQTAIRELVDTKLYLHLPNFATYRAELEKLCELPINVKHTNEIWLLFTYLFQVKKIDPFLRSWKLPVKVIRFVEKALPTLKAVIKSGWNPILLYEQGIEQAVQIEHVHQTITKKQSQKKIEQLKEMYDQLPIKQRSELALNGKDIISLLNVKPGPLVKEHLQRMERAVIVGEVRNDEQVLKEWLLTCNQKLDKNY